MSITISNKIRPMDEFRKWAYHQEGDWGSYVLFKGQKFLVTRYTGTDGKIFIKVTEDQFEPARPGYVCGTRRELPPGSSQGEALRIARTTLAQVFTACQIERARAIAALDEKTFPSEAIYNSTLGGTVVPDKKGQ